MVERDERLFFVDVCVATHKNDLSSQVRIRVRVRDRVRVRVRVRVRIRLGLGLGLGIGLSVITRSHTKF